MRRKKWIVGAVLLGIETVALIQRRGLVLSLDTVVRCRQGHLFTTIWIPGASVKALRLGWWRFQRCPVGQHWDLVTPVRLSDLTGDEKRLAAEHHDARVP